MINYYVKLYALIQPTITIHNILHTFPPSILRDLESSHLIVLGGRRHIHWLIYAMLTSPGTKPLLLRNALTLCLPS